MRPLTVHYGLAKHRSACGKYPCQVVTAHQEAVSCIRCRGTRQFATAHYADSDSFFIETDEVVIEVG